MKVADIVAVPLQLGSTLRGRRVFHPVGVLAEGRIERQAAPGVGLPIESGPVVGRVSKAVGTPAGLPDLIGLAWRMDTGDPTSGPWDVLLASAGSGLLTRFALRPTVSWSGTTLTTLMPLHRHDGWWWMKAQVTSPVGDGLSLDSVRQAIERDGMTFNVEQAHGTGGFEPLAQLRLTRVIQTDEQHDVSFDPMHNTAPGVELGPQWLTTLRERAYFLSRRGRNAPEEPAK